MQIPIGRFTEIDRHEPVSRSQARWPHEMFETGVAILLTDFREDNQQTSSGFERPCNRLE